MELKPLNTQQTRQIYYSYLVNDFPPSERVPFRRIARMMKNKTYLSFGIYEEARLLGYAFFVTDLSRRAVLGDYLSILKEYRNCGLGSEVLPLISEKLRGADYIFAEVEDPDFAGREEERSLMERRIGFYTRNGVRMTDVRAVTFGVHYRIICTPVSRMPDSEELVEMYKKIYDLRVTSFVRKRMVRIPV